MKISWGCNVNLDDLSNHNGYGSATHQIVRSLRKLGYTVSSDDKDADVHFHFDQPHHFVPPRDDMYKIIYHPWESTKLPRRWVDIMNSVDEVWTPSPLIAKWYREFAGITVPIYVFEHGVSPIWTPRKRAVDDRLRFLHVGGEASRKGLKETIQAFRLAFPSQDDVELTFKVISPGWKIAWFKNVSVNNERLDIKDLITFYHNHDVFVYPSYGEGFGLTPLEAMATGMPTITVPGWAPYARFLDEHLSIGSTLVRSPWLKTHPGGMLKPNLDDTVDAMRYVYSNFDEVSTAAFNRVPAITDYYDWDKLTESAFGDLAHRLENLPKKSGLKTHSMV